MNEDDEQVQCELPRSGSSLADKVHHCLALAVAAPGAAGVVQVLWSFNNPVYRLTPIRCALIVSAAVATLAAAWLLWSIAFPGLAVGGLVVGLLWAVAINGLVHRSWAPSVAAVIGTVLVHGARKGRDNTLRAVMAGVSAVAGIGGVVQLRPWDAVVVCTPTWAPLVPDRFDRIDSVEQYGWSGEGVTEEDGILYAYECRKGRLVHFEQIGTTDA